MKQDFYDRTRAAKYLGIHPVSLSRKTSGGQIACYKISNKTLYTIEDLNAYINSKRMAAKHEINGTVVK